MSWRRTEMERLRGDAQAVQVLTEAPGNGLPDEVFNLMATVLRVLDNGGHICWCSHGPHGDA